MTGEKKSFFLRRRRKTVPSKSSSRRIIRKGSRTSHSISKNTMIHHYFIFLFWTELLFRPSVEWYWLLFFEDDVYFFLFYWYYTVSELLTWPVNARVLSSWRWQLSVSCSFPLSYIRSSLMYFLFLPFLIFFERMFSLSRVIRRSAITKRLIWLWDDVLVTSCHTEERYYQTNINEVMDRQESNPITQYYVMWFFPKLNSVSGRTSHQYYYLDSDHWFVLFTFIYSIDRSMMIYANSSISSSIRWHSDDPWTSVRTSSKSGKIH